MAAKHFIITPRTEEILRTVHFYRYMTAVDITNLLFSEGSLTHVRSILKLLCGGADTQDNQYLFRFPLPQLTSGKTEKVFTLGSRGRDFLRDHGLSVDWYFKPSHTRQLSHGIISHNLTLTRFLVCASVFGKKSDFRLISTKICYELGKIPVIPDGWLHFKRGGRNYPVLVEIDRGTAFRKNFKEHIKSRVEFIQSGEYQKLFHFKGGLVAYLTTGEIENYRESRLKFMRSCCKEVLAEMDMSNWHRFLDLHLLIEKICMNRASLTGGCGFARTPIRPLPSFTTRCRCQS